ncbi:hypothetical protein [Actinoallomurus sp. CA-150999]|uniref:hypothetical protein n=1 Tax=Actinoallomurus sp. CA-150999 TaxID=3239887 RepID=UPI003D8D0111
MTDTDPIKSKYDIHPYDPNDKTNTQTPDLGNTDSPELKVWDSRPSFNTDPQDIKEGDPGDPGAGTTQIDVDDILVTPEAMAAQVENMLTTSRELVQSYEDLRKKVLGGMDTVFGQQAMDTAFQDSPGTTYLAPGTYNPAPNEGERSPSDWQGPAKQFAASMNPVQEKNLQNIGDALEVLGEYIALVNHSGQVYAHTDKQSKFPPPPSWSVYGSNMSHK